MILKVKKNHEESKIPVKANEADAGFDLFAHSMRIVGEEITKGIYSRIDFIEYNCGLSIEPKSERIWFSNSGGALSEARHYFTFLAPRSSISKYNLFLANGLGILDAPYRGPILARFKYLPAASDLVFFDVNKHPSCGITIDESRIYKVGDRVAQLVVAFQPKVEIMEAMELSETERDKGGFGSSGT